MNKITLFAMVLLLAITQSFEIHVPPEVSAAFAKKFPLAKNINWSKENANEYEAGFKLNGKSVSANFLSDGSWVETESELDIQELPGAVAASVKIKYPQGILLKAFKIEKAKGEPAYEVELKNKGKKTEIILKQDGTVI